MDRFLLSCFAGLVEGATLGVLDGSLAAWALSGTPDGDKLAWYVVGPAGALLGSALGGWIVWRLLVEEGRRVPILVFLLVQFVALSVVIATNVT